MSFTEVPPFDADSHAMAMDRRPVIEKIKDLGKMIVEKHKASWSEKPDKPTSIDVTKVDIGL